MTLTTYGCSELVIHREHENNGLYTLMDTHTDRQTNRPKDAEALVLHNAPSPTFLLGRAIKMRQSAVIYILLYTDM